MARHVVAILKRSGYISQIARDGVEALKLIETHPYDLVSSDIEMPRMDGYELCRRLRENPRFQALPVLALSSHADKVDRIKGFEAGFDEYLTKPVDEDIFIATIERHLARRNP